MEEKSCISMDVLHVIWIMDYIHQIQTLYTVKCSKAVDEDSINGSEM